MYVMIDNYDSFVYNLAIYFKEIGRDITVIRNDEITISCLENLLDRGLLEGLILSPGPKGPWDCGNCRDIVKAFEGRIPILGVCLGHQIIGYVYGADVRKGKTPVHGKISKIRHSGRDLFHGLPEEFKVTRYHSLVVDEAMLPSHITIEAKTDDQVVMALRHRDYPIYGVQFHPEAVLTEYGHEILENFCRICDEFALEKQASA